MFIAENVIAERRGAMRPSFIRTHLEAVARAVGEGLPVLGYFYRSLMDNFEWDLGFRPRFGLYTVNYATMARTPASGSETFLALTQTDSSAQTV